MSELSHAGVKGMKWGVRKKKPTPTVDKDGNPLTKAQRKEIRKKQTRNSKLAVAGGAATLAGGAYLINKATGGALINSLPTETVARGKAAVMRTAGNMQYWKWNAGVSPIDMAYSIGRDIVYNYRDTKIVR